MRGEEREWERERTLKPQKEIKTDPGKEYEFSKV